MKARRKCGDAILKAVADLGPSTIEMIALVTGISKKDLRQSMALLRRRGLIEMLVGDERTFFYQLSQSLSARTSIGHRMKGRPEDFVKPLLRRQDRYHDQWCEYWALSLRKAFPDVITVRDYSIGSNTIAREILLLDEFDYELLPDFLAIFPGRNGSRVAIAFEIERTRKSEKRLVRKFSRYMEETRIDGLVYVCDSGRLAETLRSLYESKLIHKTQRVFHYRENFFLFSDSLAAGSRPLETFMNVNGKQVSLFNWCATLCTDSRSQRRDANFKHA